MVENCFKPDVLKNRWSVISARLHFAGWFQILTCECSTGLPFLLSHDAISQKKHFVSYIC